MGRADLSHQRISENNCFLTQNCTSSSSRMRFMSHNWSATKQRLHPQSVAEISRHSVLSGDRIRQCETSSGSRHKDTDQCLPFPSAGTAVSLFNWSRQKLQAPQCPCSTGHVKNCTEIRQPAAELWLHTLHHQQQKPFQLLYRRWDNDNSNYYAST